MPGRNPAGNPGLRNVRIRFRTGRTTVRRAAPALSDQVLFLDVLEIAVRADFQFDGRGFVAYDDSVRVYLHGRNRADMRVGTFDALLQGAGFLVAEREDQHLLRIEHRGDAYRHGLLGNLVHVVVEETRVHDQRVVGQRLDAGARVERREVVSY